MITTVGFIMLLVIVIILLSGKVSLPPIFVVIPIVAALVCGFSMDEIGGFIQSGLSATLNTAVLFAFALTYFCCLNEIGIFDVIVAKVLRLLGNRIESVMWITIFVACLSHLDGAGATTMLVTIPLMLPLYEKMKIRKEALILVSGIAAGCMNMLPWCASVARLSQAIEVEIFDLWQYCLPMQIAALVVTVLAVFPIAAMERKHGAGLTDVEFAELKATAISNINVSVSKKIFWADIVLTVILIGILLSGVMSASMGFMLGTVVMLLINYPTTKEQIAQIKKFGGNSIYMIMIIFAIGVMTGILKGTGMMTGMVNAILSIVPESLGTHLAFVIALVAVPLSICLGSDSMYMAFAPLLVGVGLPFGIAPMQMGAGILFGACFSAQLCLVGPTPYLALGLANVDMRDSLKYSFGWVWVLGIIVAIFGGVIGIIPM